MPSCSKSKNPRGIEIIFTEDDHKYKSTIDGKEVQYVSGTQFIGKFFSPFDPTGIITERCAKKEGITVEELKARWQAKGANSCRLGTRLHETIEDILQSKSLRNKPEDIEEEKRFKNGVEVAKKILAKTEILGIEKIVFSDRLMLAGTIDLLVKSKKTNQLILIDHKTNKSIDKVNIYKKFCLSPIQHIPDISFWHYALQLNLYQYLLVTEGYVPKNSQFKRFLNHVTIEKQEFIELPDLQLEIKDMLIDYLSAALKDMSIK